MNFLFLVSFTPFYGNKKKQKKGKKEESTRWYHTHGNTPDDPPYFIIYSIISMYCDYLIIDYSMRMRKNFHGNDQWRNKMAESNVGCGAELTELEVDSSVSDVKNQSRADRSHNNSFVGNISNHIPLQEGHERPISKGNLIFNACFEGGK